MRCHLVLGKHVFIRFGIGQVDIRPIIGNGIDLHRPRAIGIGQIPAERQIAAFRQIASNVVTHHARVFVGRSLNRGHVNSITRRTNALHGKHDFLMRLRRNQVVVFFAVIVFLEGVYDFSVRLEVLPDNHVFLQLIFIFGIDERTIARNEHEPQRTSAVTVVAIGIEPSVAGVACVHADVVFHVPGIFVGRLFDLHRLSGLLRCRRRTRIAG